MSFVYFRLPHTGQVYRNRITKEPEEIASLAELNGRRGFVIAPFTPSDGCPILLLDADFEPVEVADDCPLDARLVDADHAGERSRYAADFGKYHAQLLNGTFSKIVLARSARLTATVHIPPLSLFARACRKYPRMFVALFSTERSGTWLIATPEILISGTHGDMQTMALAGTMRKECGNWSAKNIQEQRYVETYITECVGQYTHDISVEGPYTTHAGDLVHLRSDIRFSLADTSRLGDILNALHPTPAVCGMPKAATRDFIINNESAPRGYYSGFSGLLDSDGSTNLFVTLRCMKMDDSTNADSYTLYAGGGLLKDSTEQSEWDETEAKMNTMRQIFFASDK